MGWCGLIGAALVVVAIMAAFDADGGMGLALFCLLFATGPVAGIVIGVEHKQAKENLRVIQASLASSPKMAEAVSAPMVAAEAPAAIVHKNCSCICEEKP